MRSLTAGYSRSERVEALKWIAAALMVYEHTWRFALGVFPLHVQFLGRAVLPLFVVAFALSLSAASRESVVAACKRLFVCGVLAIPLCALVRDAVPLNVLLTFAAGTLAYCMTSGIMRGRWIAVLLLLVAGFGLEFGPLGVVAVWAGIAAAREHRKRQAVTLWVACCVALIGCQDSMAHAVVGGILAVGLMFLPVGVPRVRHLFYGVYLAQWPMIAAIGVVAR